MPQVSTSQQIFKFPEEIRGFPKVEPRKLKTDRRKGKSIIATDTPEKHLIEEKALVKENKIIKVTKRQKETFCGSSNEEPVLDSSAGDKSLFQVSADVFQDPDRKPIESDFMLREFASQKRKKKL